MSLLANPKDFIEVKFDLDTIDKPNALKSYMNTLVNSNDDLQAFRIRKVAFYWGFTEGKFVYYMFAPPWIRIIVNDPVNQIKTNLLNHRRRWR